MLRKLSFEILFLRSPGTNPEEPLRRRHESSRQFQRPRPRLRRQLLVSRRLSPGLHPERGRQLPNAGDKHPKQAEEDDRGELPRLQRRAQDVERVERQVFDRRGRAHDTHSVGDDDAAEERSAGNERL